MVKISMFWDAEYSSRGKCRLERMTLFVGGIGDAVASITAAPKWFRLDVWLPDGAEVLDVPLKDYGPLQQQKNAAELWVATWLAKALELPRVTRLTADTEAVAQQFSLESMEEGAET